MSNANTPPQRPTRQDLSRLLIMGPPGAGKGTQASSIAGHFGVPAVSTGDIFRGLQTADTPLAVRVRGIMGAPAGMSTTRRRTRLSLSVSLPRTAATDSCWTVTLGRSGRSTT